MVSRRSVLKMGAGGLATSLSGCSAVRSLAALVENAMFTGLVPVDGGYLVPGSHWTGDGPSEPWLARLDESFAVRERWSVDSPDGTVAPLIWSVGDGVVLLVDSRPVLRRLAPDGSTLWEREYASLEAVTITSVCECNGDVVVAGTYFPRSATNHSSGVRQMGEPAPKIHLGRLDHEGRYEPLLSQNPWGIVRDVAARGGRLYLAGTATGRTVNAGFVLPPGLQWVGRYDRGDLQDVFQGVGGSIHRIVPGDDGLIAEGGENASSGPDTSPFVAPLTTEGAVQWERNPPIGNTKSLSPTSDGGALVVGHYDHTESFWSEEPDEEDEERPIGPWAVKYDGAGEREWVKRPEDTIVFVYDVVALDDDRYAVVGFRERAEDDGVAAWIAVLTADGTVERSNLVDPPTD